MDINITTPTKSQIGLGNVDNTSDAGKPVSIDQATALGLKVDKVAGKGLSTEDYTTAEKSIVADAEFSLISSFRMMYNY